MTEIEVGLLLTFRVPVYVECISPRDFYILPVSC